VARKLRYDRQEVDAFFVRLSEEVRSLRDQAARWVAKADDLEQQLADARRARDDAQATVGTLLSQVARLESRGQSEPAEAYRSLHILQSGQEEADARLREAKEQAGRALDDARALADEIVAEAEADAARMRDDLERCVDELGQRKRLAVLAELGELEHVRDDLVDAVLRHQRALHAVRVRIATVIDALEKPDDGVALPVIDLTSELVLDSTRRSR
jgi:vacuolar-type H+-ATPase subunit H